jgi:hypothetical protein
MEKTIGELIDEISVVNIKIFMMVEQVERHENKVEDAWKMNALVKRRSELRNAINKKLNEREEIKVYGTLSNK